jgi:hypothetical protein
MNRHGLAQRGEVGQMKRMESSPAPILTPLWLAHRYEPAADNIHFVKTSRKTRSDIAFLTDELIGTSAERRVLSRADTTALAENSNAPLHYIFHSAYCCSTLLAKALDIVGVASTLKEPQLLNDLTGWRHQGADAADVIRVLELSLSLLARPFEERESVIIKPSNVINAFIPAMMNARAEARAILLYAPLKSYLTSIARKGMWGRLWARELLSRQLVDGLVAPFGFAGRDHILHTDLQSAAVGWLAQHKLFLETAKKWPDRVRTLNSEALVANPVSSLRACAQLFGLTMDDAAIDAIVKAEFSRNAKDGSAFAEGQRDAERAAGESTHLEEIEKVAIWANAVAESAGVPMRMPGDLLA